jgi:hypothetical protein
MSYRLQNRTIELTAVTAVTGLDAFDIQSQWGFSTALQWTHTAGTGNIKLQKSNDGQLWFDIEDKTIDLATATEVLFEVQTFTAFTRVLIDITGGTVDAFKLVFNSKG